MNSATVLSPEQAPTNVQAIFWAALWLGRCDWTRTLCRPSDLAFCSEGTMTQTNLKKLMRTPSCNSHLGSAAV